MLDKFKSQRFACVKQKGFSLVELMIGIAVGMIVVAGASMFFIQQVSEHKRLVLETQIQQDLRAVSDSIYREIRRAGANSKVGILVYPRIPGYPLAVPNAYAKETSVSANKDQINYSYSLSDSRSSQFPLDPEDNVALDNEKFGFRLIDDRIEFMRSKGSWSPMTDPDLMQVTSLVVDESTQTLSLLDNCEVKVCPAASTSCPPELTVKNYNITIKAVATHDIQVQRTHKFRVGMRNDDVKGNCP